ncbi:MAG: hypothetical protein PHY93_11400 [Bacteriovorax sp.]|nr:hypothetical protein [Bacteriovorax sp.]
MKCIMSVTLAFFAISLSVSAEVQVGNETESISRWNDYISANICTIENKTLFIQKLTDVIVDVDVESGSVMPDSKERQVLDSYRQKLDSVAIQIIRKDLPSLKQQLGCDK